MPAPAPERATALDQILVFTLEGKELGMPIAPVIEILPYQGVTPVPRSSTLVEGILALRGRMVTVVDLRRTLAMSPRAPGARSQVIVVDSAGDLLGLVVDSVARVDEAEAGVSPLDLERLIEEMA